MKRLINGSDDRSDVENNDSSVGSGKYDGFVHYELDPSRNYPRLVDDPGLKADKKVFQASVSDVLRNCAWRSKQDAGDFRMRACILFGLPTELADAPTDVLIDELEDVSKATDNLKADEPLMEREVKIHTFGEKDDNEGEHAGGEIIASPFDSLFEGSQKKKDSAESSERSSYGTTTSKEDPMQTDVRDQEDDEDDDDNGEVDG